ncbi:MAG: MFS transporter [Solirubrobacteraceae bacterium]
MVGIESISRTRACASAGKGARHALANSPRTVLVVMCVGYFLVLLDVTIVNVGLPRIASGLHASVSDLQWVVDGYALALASLMLAGGTVGDLRGHKRMVLLGLMIFGLSSLACSLAPDVDVLVAARALQGVGAALLLPGSLAIISRAFPNDGERAKAIGIWAGIGSLALPAGPLLGGVLIAAFGWRAIFLVNVPIVVLSFAIAAAIVTESVDRYRNRLDKVGVVLGMALLFAMTFSFIEGGRVGASAPPVIGSALATVLLVVLFLLVEHHRGSEAMLPLELFRRAEFSVANAAAGTMNLCTLGTLFLLTLFLQSVRGDSPLAAGLELIPLFAPLALIAPLAGRLSSRIGPRLPIGVGFLLSAGGLALLALAGAATSYWLLLAAFLLWGMGLGFVTPAVVGAAIAAVSRERSGLASAVNNTTRQAGGAVGIAIAGAIAGQPSSRHVFLAGFHAVALGSAVLYVMAAAVGMALIPHRTRAVS